MRALVVFALLSCYLIFSRCHSSVNPLQRCDALPQQKIISTYTNAKGIIRRYNSSSLFYIEIVECNCQEIGATPKGLTAPPSPCNLPSEYKENGLPILFSGQLRADTTLNYEIIDISGTPLELTKIQKN